MKYLLVSYITLLSLTMKGSNYLDYFKSIKVAEEFILSGQNDSALEVYSETFKVFKPLDKDLYNAAIVSVDLRRYSEGARFLVELSNMNTDNKYLQKRCFKHLRKTDIWKAHISQKQRKQEKSLKREHLELIIDSLFKMDQKFRRKKGGYNVYQDTIFKLDSLNITKINELIDSNMLPRYQVLNADSLKLFNHAYTIIRHHYQNKKSISNRLFNCLKNGIISPYVYAELEDKKHSFQHNGLQKYGTLNYFMFEWFPLQRKLVMIKRDSIEQVLIERCRQKIGLHSQSNINQITNKNSAYYYHGFFFGYYESIAYLHAKPFSALISSYITPSIIHRYLTKALPQKPNPAEHQKSPWFYLSQKRERLEFRFALRYGCLFQLP